MKNMTFTIIKPDAVASGYTGKILDRLIAGGFVLIGLRMTKMERGDAEKFYAVHRGKEFFDGLVEFMTSGPVVVAVLEKEDAVESLRKLVGNTDPAKATEGTIRREFGTHIRRNAIHASDSDENARAEWEQFFTASELQTPNLYRTFVPATISG